MWQTGKFRQNERLCELCSRLYMALRMSVISYYFVTHIMISEMNIHPIQCVQRKVLSI